MKTTRNIRLTGWAPTMCARQCHVGGAALRGDGRNLPYFEWFSHGRLFNMTGYHQDEFAGDSYVCGRLGYAHRWNSPYTNGVYGGIMAEAGNAIGCRSKNAAART